MYVFEAFKIRLKKTTWYQTFHCQCQMCSVPRTMNYHTLNIHLYMYIYRYFCAWFASFLSMHDNTQLFQTIPIIQTARSLAQDHIIQICNCLCTYAYDLLLFSRNMVYILMCIYVYTYSCMYMWSYVYMYTNLFMFISFFSLENDAYVNYIHDNIHAWNSLNLMYEVRITRFCDISWHLRWLNHTFVCIIVWIICMSTNMNDRMVADLRTPWLNTKSYFLIFVLRYQAEVDNNMSMPRMFAWIWSRAMVLQPGWYMDGHMNNLIVNSVVPSDIHQRLFIKTYW